jgi:hypothetical protein
MAFRRAICFLVVCADVAPTAGFACIREVESSISKAEIKMYLTVFFIVTQQFQLPNKSKSYFIKIITNLADKYKRELASDDRGAVFRVRAIKPENNEDIYRLKWRF